MAVDLRALAGVGKLGAVDLEDRHVAVEHIADIEIPAVGAEADPLAEAADLDLSDLGHSLAADLQDRQAAGLVIEERLLVTIAAPQQDGNREVSFRADCQPFRPIADDDEIDDA